MATEHFKREQFLSVIQDDEELFFEILSSINFEGLMSDYQKAVSENNWSEVYLINHKIKGIAKNLFFEQLAEVCIAVEIVIKNQKIPEERLLNELLGEMGFLQKILAEELKTR
jgi:HPt (histidine-containing phosphotransfer) domain-containing protein